MATPDFQSFFHPILKTSYEYVKTIDPKVILIDGQALANLMIENNVGTSTVESYQIKKIDLDYFES